MYSTTIKFKVDEMFVNLRKEVADIVERASTSSEAVSNVTEIVSSELTSRSKSILSDMLYALSDALLKTDFFSDISRQNSFFEINLRQEIFNKYQFESTTSVDYKEASKTIQALVVGGGTLATGAMIEVGYVLVAGLSFSSLVPIPIGVLIAASIATAFADYCILEPKKNKRELLSALDKYLEQMEQQFLEWFDEIEKYFNMRVEEIKQTM